LSSEKLFETIKDGAWHNLNELSEQVRAPIDKLVEFARFLSKKGVAEYEETAQKIRIASQWQTLLPDESIIKTA